MKDKQKQIEKLQSILPNIELVRCMYGDIDFATNLYDHGCRQIDDNSVVMTKSEKEKLLHEMYEQGKFDALADLDKEGKVVLSHDEFVSFIKTDKEAQEYGQQCWNDGKAQGVKEFAEFIKSQMGMEREYMGIKYRQGVFSNYDIDEFIKQFNKGEPK